MGYRDTPRGRAMALIGAARRRAIRLGLAPCTLDPDDITRRIAAGICEATGLPFDLTRAHQRGATRPFAPTIDRTNPWHGGYAPENCRVVIAAYNQAKGRWGDDVLMLVATHLTRTLKRKHDMA